MKPSDVAYITCTPAYGAYKSIKNCDEAYQFLVNSSDPRNVFVKYFMNSVEDSSALQPIMKSEYQKEHLFTSFVPTMIGILFNTVDKNFATETNSRIHDMKKRFITDNQSSAKRKIRKLTSK